ncbi:YopX family protein [Liquorilactobacillus satsumensis]|uniref:YopX family protein n=1 Tax=Liquorilactobacillus satsumensis TaxID=259059 RepID=UPI0039EC9485
MREIKFRAWDKTHKILANVLEIDFYIGKVALDDGEAVWALGLKNVVLEQYTGLKDKNGKEIYEGSLVKYTEDGDSFISEVKYFGNDDYPAFDIEAPSAFYFESNVLSSGVANNCLEVVGNIHENPELLEVSE